VGFAVCTVWFLGVYGFSVSDPFSFFLFLHGRAGMMDGFVEEAKEIFGNIYLSLD